MSGPWNVSKWRPRSIIQGLVRLPDYPSHFVNMWEIFIAINNDRWREEASMSDTDTDTLYFELRASSSLLHTSLLFGVVVQSPAAAATLKGGVETQSWNVKHEKLGKGDDLTTLYGANGYNKTIFFDTKLLCGTIKSVDSKRLLRSCYCNFYRGLCTLREDRWWGPVRIRRAKIFKAILSYIAMWWK